MKILFVENREKTLFWEQVALNLQEQGHQTVWLVQNPLFRPRRLASNAEVFVLPFPRNDVGAVAEDIESWVREAHPTLITDRGRNFFEAGAAHYDHYTAEISRVLREQSPDLVIGESTLFHELITIGLCRSMAVPYVQPMSNRYPQGRFSLLAFDTQVPMLESGDVWAGTNALDLAQRVATGTEVPFYMRRPGRLEAFQRRSVWAFARGRVLLARLHGERYNTPSLARKLALHRQVKNNLMRWRELERMPADPKATLLYPMQLQPEANLDVWGAGLSDQVALIREMLSAAPPNYQIAVKANPKAKYELSEELFSLAENDPRVCFLPLELAMPVALANSIGAVTVTGTVGFEAICGKGRAISLRHPIIEREFPLFHAGTVGEAVSRLLNDPLAGVGNVEMGAQLIQRFVAQSFPGLVADPISYPQCIEPENIKLVSLPVCRLLNKLKAVV